MRLPLNPGMLGAGIVVAALGVAAVLWIQRGAHIDLKGSILKARTISLDEQSTIAVIDFRFTNTSDYPFVVAKVEAFVEDAKGERTGSDAVSETDAKELFTHYPILGQKYNPSLLMRDRIPGRQSLDRMICARFPLLEAQMAARKRFVIRIEDVDGPTAEILEAPGLGR